MGDSCARGGKPGIKETGTPEDVPRTAAITHAADTKKAPTDVMGALLRLELHGFPHPVAELAATVERVSRRPSSCNLRKPLQRSLQQSLASDASENIPTSISEWPDNNSQRSREWGDLLLIQLSGISAFYFVGLYSLNVFQITLERDERRIKLLHRPRIAEINCQPVQLTPKWRFNTAQSFQR